MLIPRNQQQIASKGDIDQMPVLGEWSHKAMDKKDIILWSSDDISGCFHVFSRLPAWRQWVITSKPIEMDDNNCSTENDFVCTRESGDEHTRLSQHTCLIVVPHAWLALAGVLMVLLSFFLRHPTSSPTCYSCSIVHGCRVPG